MSQIKIADETGHGISYIPVRFGKGHQSSEEAGYDALSKIDGTQGWPVPDWPVQDYTLHVNTGDFANPAYASESRYIPKPANGAYGDEVFTLSRTGIPQPGPTVVEPVSRLHCEWLDFVNEQGAPVYLRGATFFPAYEFFLRGESLEAPLLELQGLGCNALRVFGMSKYIQENELHRPAFKPQDWGDRYYDALPEFCRAMASYGQYIYWSIFPDNGYIMPDVTQQVAHFNRMMEKLSVEPNNIIELTNEPNGHSFNAVDVTKFTKPSGIPSNSGSYGDEYGGDLPPWPVWDFGDIHTSRSYPKQVLDSCTLNHPIAVKLHRPVGVGEPDRFGSGGNTDARKAAASAGAAMLSAFWFFHSRVGERCGVFDDETRPCALAAFQVLTAVR